MSYYAGTLALLGIEPLVSPHAREVVTQAEMRLGFQAPPSVREWFSRPDAIQILNDHSNQDHAVAPQDWQTVAWGSHRLIPIRHENQYVCTWAFVLDDSPDPPVYVDVDGQGWVPCAPTLSEYVHATVWDYHAVLERPVLVQAQNGPLSAAALEDLSKVASAERSTFGWPASVQYRFRLGEAALLIWAGENQADWFVGAADELELQRALARLWNIDNVGPALYGETAAATRVLARLQQRP